MRFPRAGAGREGTCGRRARRGRRRSRSDGALILGTASKVVPGLHPCCTHVLQRLYLIRTLQPWYTNDLKRLVKTSKLHFLDSELLAALRNLSSARLGSDQMAFGALLETFVLGELLKLASWNPEQIEFFHFRSGACWPSHITLAGPNIGWIDRLRARRSGKRDDELPGRPCSAGWSAYACGGAAP